MKIESKAIGGKARAEALSSEERSKIARKAAQAKWKPPKAIYGTPDKKLKIGERELECYVLEDKKRVLSGRGMQEALGLGRAHGSLLKEFVNQKSITSFLSDKLAEELNNPIRFIRPGRGGVRASGFEAHILPDLCDAILEARNQGILSGGRQLVIAKQCEVIVRALSKVGITALIDEVTGFQEIRDREILQKILDKYITDEWAKWTKTFPDIFYRELFRLKGVNYPSAGGRKPQYVGHWTNDIVYSRLAPGVKDELKQKNPRVPKTGNRKFKDHQFLTRDYGHPELKDLLSNVTFLMKGCSTYKEFESLLNKARPKFGNTIELDV